MPEPVEYMARTKQYYEAQGFAAAYEYARHDSAPFAPVKKPLAESRLGVITTASRYFREDLEPRKVDFGDVAQIPEQMFADDLSWDKEATHLKDVNSFLPLATLQELAAEGVIGSLAPRFACAPTEYSQRSTTEYDAPRILDVLVQDEVDVALLVPL